MRTICYDVIKEINSKKKREGYIYIKKLGARISCLQKQEAGIAVLDHRTMKLAKMVYC